MLFSLLRSQRGFFSPFMIGLVMAIGIFSNLAMHWAQKDLERIREERLRRQQAEANDIAKAVEFAILTETDRTYGQVLDVDDLRQYTALSQGKTRGGSDVQIISRQNGSAFETANERIAITTTDDTLRRNELVRSGSAEDLAREAGGDEPLAIVDTSAVRQRQIEQSKQNVDTMAAHIFQFYSTNFRFPKVGEYEELQEMLNIKDVWGNDLIYTYKNEEEAVLEFSTPWNYTYSVNLNLEN